MKINLNNEEIFSVLKNDPSALYLIYQTYRKRTDKLPDFMDKGKIIKILHQYSLGDKQIKIKHSHKNSFIISSEGKRFGKYLEEKKFFSIFKAISLNSRRDFEEYYYMKLQNFDSLDKWYFNYTNHEILQLYGLKPIGKFYSQDHTKFKILKYRCVDFEMNKFEFELLFVCKKCKEENIFKQQIVFSENGYIPSYFDQTCKKCDLNFHCDSSFKRFSMFEKD
ncbi:MAG: hypothetical protein ACTSWL_00220 [Promethearchaeota archaeon]